MKLGLGLIDLPEGSTMGDYVFALEQQLSTMTKDRDEWKESCEDANTRFKEAEQRISESQGQEPAVNITGGVITWAQVPAGYNGQLFFNPIIPPSLEELQREYAEAQEECTALRMGWDEKIRENADLTRKLAEQQAAVSDVFVLLNAQEESDYPESAIAQAVRMLSKFNSKELNNLLAEARSQAVPEDSSRLDFVLKNSAFIMQGFADAGGSAVQLLTQNEDEEYVILHNADSFFKTARDAIDAAMLTAAPKPEGDLK